MKTSATLLALVCLLLGLTLGCGRRRAPPPQAPPPSPLQVDVANGALQEAKGKRYWPVVIGPQSDTSLLLRPEFLAQIAAGMEKRGMRPAASLREAQMVLFIEHGPYEQWQNATLQRLQPQADPAPPLQALLASPPPDLQALLVAPPPAWQPRPLEGYYPDPLLPTGPRLTQGYFLALRCVALQPGKTPSLGKLLWNGQATYANAFTQRREFPVLLTLMLESLDSGVPWRADRLKPGPETEELRSKSAW